jgi:dipeptidyl aminopeptidase/acylaminoacyl peptidase
MHPIRAEFAIEVIDALSFGSVHSYDMDAGAWRRWTSPPHRERPAPDVELVRYPTFDSVSGDARTIPAVVFRPAGETDGRLPVAIGIHGGPGGQSFPFSTPVDRAIIAEGVVLIRPNVRGSSGYGREYMSLDDRERREDAVRDIGALLDWIGAQSDMDADRIGVYGGSYGGYMTLATLVNYSDRVRCGFDLFGISHLAGYVEASREDHFPEAQRQEFGDERDPVMRAFLDSISPVNRAAEIRVPLLVFQGLNDVRVKPAESRRMVDAMREAGRHVRYIEAENEGHGFEHPLNLLYVAAAAMDFLAECLELD